MFTGIVEEAGTVEVIRPTEKAIQLTVRAHVIGRGLKLGASVAVNGCCLTVVKLAARGRDRLIQFDLLQESWRLTNLQFAPVGSLVNLERPLRADGELGGHFVTGHVDGVGRVVELQRQGDTVYVTLLVPPEGARFAVLRGSIALDGVSLTLTDVEGERVSVALIPYTLENTTLGSLRIGDRVNVEFDILAKYAAAAALGRSMGLTLAALEEEGF